jgi:choice-of-anchor C domain-containing protein
MVFSSSAAAILAGLVLLVSAQVEAPAPPQQQPKQADEPRNLIDNGDFEDSDAGEMYARHDKEEPPPGWTVKRGTVDVIGGWWQAAHGKQSLDLNGLEPGAISQEVATEPGKTYVLSFWMAGNPDDPEPRRTAIEIAWDKKVVRTVVFDRKPEHAHKSMGWTHHETRLRATAKRTRIDFTSLSEGGWGPALDDIRLIEAPVEAVAHTDERH